MIKGNGENKEERSLPEIQNNQQQENCVVDGLVCYFNNIIIQLQFS